METVNKKNAAQDLPLRSIKRPAAYRPETSSHLCNLKNLQLSERKYRGKDMKILSYVSLILCIHILSLLLDGFVTMAKDGAFIVEG